MAVQDKIAATMGQGETPGEFSLNIIFREITEEDGEKVTPYWVAECLEIPGCVSQGDTREAAEHNIEDAMRQCLSVMFEDCMKRVAANHELPNLRGITSQKRLHVNTIPQLELV